jgi:hypothetical protein
MKDILKQIREHKKKGLELQAILEEKRGNQTFLCCCGKRHKFKDCVFVDKHYYSNEAYSEGWEHGEYQIICPKIGVHNRLLFGNHNEDRNTPSKQFASLYSSVFKERKDVFENNYQWQNNFYISENLSKYGISEGDN